MIRRLYIILAVSILAVSCESEYETALVGQEKFIDEYIGAQLADYTVTRNEGVNRVTVKEGNGLTIEKGDKVTFHYAGYVLTAQGPTSVFTTDRATVTVGDGEIIKGLDIGLVGARDGEESLMLFTAKYGYGKNSVNLVPEASALMFQTLVTNVQKSED